VFSPSLLLTPAPAPPRLGRYAAARQRVSRGCRAGHRPGGWQAGGVMFVYPPICRLIVWEEIQESQAAVAALEAPARAGPVHRPWTPQIAQQRLMAVINGECCFNCFKVCRTCHMACVPLPHPRALAAPCVA